MMASYVLRTDGGSRGNPGPAAAGFVIEDPSGGMVCRGGRFLGETTNNVAEYEGLIWGLQTAIARGYDLSAVYCDSELVVKQINGEYKVKHPNMRPLFERAKALLHQTGDVEVVHVPREENVEADRMVNEALDAEEDVGDACEPDILPGQGSLFETEE